VLTLLPDLSSAAHDTAAFPTLFLFWKELRVGDSRFACDQLPDKLQVFSGYRRLPVRADVKAFSLRGFDIGLDPKFSENSMNIAG
jgi:hypothetical protein